MPVRLSALHSSEAEQALWVSPEGRPGGIGVMRIVFAALPPNFSQHFILSLRACACAHSVVSNSLRDECVGIRQHAPG